MMKKQAGYIAAAAFAALWARSEYEKKSLQTITYQIMTDQLTHAWDGCRMLFLSDLHGNCFGQDNIKLIEQVYAFQPDYILIGGDMMVVKPWKKWNGEALKQVLKALRACAPVFYAEGNHESRMKEQKETYPGWYEQFLAILKECDITFLSNQTIMLERENSHLFVHGLSLESIYYKKGKKKILKQEVIKGQIGTTSAPGFHLLLAHSPIYAYAYQAWNADLTLCGHFHGGTIRIPYLGGLMSPEYQFFSKYNRDWILEKDMPVIISSGLGTHSVNIRLNNIPQLVGVILKTVD